MSCEVVEPDGTDRPTAKTLRSRLNPAHWPRYCARHAPELFDTAVPTDASHGFDPDGGLGEIAPLKWKDGKPSYSILSHSVDLGAAETEAIIKNAVGAWRDATDGALDPCYETRRPHNADIQFRFETERDNEQFHKHPQIIGYAYFPGAEASQHVTNYITFNDSYFYVEKDSALVGKVPGLSRLHDDEYEHFKTIILRNVCMHEFGHAIGLPHAKDDPKAVMAPFYNGQIDLQASDIERARAIYGGLPPGRSPYAPSTGEGKEGEST